MDDRESELSEHLEELRTRLLRCIVYIVLGAVAAWFLYDWVYDFLTGPVVSILNSTGTKFMMTRVAEGFMLRCQVTLIAGVIFAAPLLTFEMWGFVAPALTKEERRPVLWIAPLCVVLFASGVAVAYFILPAAMRFFIAYVPKGAELRPMVSENLVFIVKMILAFGLVFELPIVMVFLGKLGIVNSRMLVRSWRYSLVAISLVAAVATPSGDLFSMTAMAVPLVFLYILSIALVKMVQPK